MSRALRVCGRGTLTNVNKAVVLLSDGTWAIDIINTPTDDDDVVDMTQEINDMIAQREDTWEAILSD